VSIARRAAWLPLALVVGGFAASPAYAATATWRTPTDNATYTGTGNIDFLVAISRSLTEQRTSVQMSLTVPGPQAGPYVVAPPTTGNEIRFTFTPACPNYAGPCSSGAAPAYNGRYTATLSGGASGTRTITLSVPPAAPTGVTATATGQHRVKVTWSANREPDLTGYDVYTEDGGIVAQSLPVDTLSYEFELPDTGYGGEHGYVVRAHRLACGNCSGDAAATQLDSPMSAPGRVTLNEPTPDPQPSDGGYNGGDGTGSGTNDNGGNGTGGGGYNGGDGSTGGNGNGTGGNPTSGPSSEPAYNDGSNSGQFHSGPKPTANAPQQVAQQRAAFGLTFKNFAPKLGAPKLPPLPQFTEAPLPEGTYDPLLDYGPQEAEGPDRIAEGGGITTTLVDSFTSVFEGRKLFRSIAIALLLLLAAGHLRLWLRTDPSGR
jgi:uncharacterized membrane protein YgcG